MRNHMTYNTSTLPLSTPVQVCRYANYTIIIRAPYAPISIIMPRQQQQWKQAERSPHCLVVFGAQVKRAWNWANKRKSENLQETLGPWKIVCENGKWVPWGGGGGTWSREIAKIIMNFDEEDDDDAAFFLLAWPKHAFAWLSAFVAGMVA